MSSEGVSNIQIRKGACCGMATVLIVEDNPDNREIYRTYLEFAGHTVVEAANGVEGVALARVRSPDIILMDVTMPVMDGLEATRRIKSDPDTAAIPIIMLSAHELDSDREAAALAGADGYLSKPCPPRDVLAAVVERIQSPEP